MAMAFVVSRVFIIILYHVRLLFKELAGLLNLPLGHLSPWDGEVSLDEVDIREGEGKAINGLNALDVEVPLLQKGVFL
jgi:hypothetical protein